MSEVKTSTQESKTPQRPAAPPKPHSSTSGNTSPSGLPLAPFQFPKRFVEESVD